MPTKVALLGAGGKIGVRISRNLKAARDYAVSYVEIAAAGIENLRQLGLAVTPEDAALADAEIVVLAVPDVLIGRLSVGLIPKLRPGTIVVGLDPAAAYAEVAPIRPDLSYFVVHPCHPPLFADQRAADAETDWFGGREAPQHIVCSLYAGPEADYARAEAFARAMFEPVLAAHRISIEQMAILEPALVETFALSLVVAIGEAFEIVVEKMGVPREAARVFLLGHLRTQMAQILGFADFPYSEGARLAVERAQSRIFQPDWRDAVFDLPAIRESVEHITGHFKAPRAP